MPEINFSTIVATRTGENASTGKQTEQAFNGNFSLAKSLFEQLFAVASITVTSEEITQLKVDTTTTPYTLYYTTDTTEPITWNRLINVGFSNLSGNPTDNIALNSALELKADKTSVATMQNQVNGLVDNVSTLQSDVADRVRVPHESILYLRYDGVTESVQYSINGTTWIDVASASVSFAGISGDAGDNESLVNYVAAQIAEALLTIGNTYTTQESFTEHITDYNNPHNVTKAQVGLGNVDNTSDADKPISNAVQQAFDNIIGNMPPVYSVSPTDYREGASVSGAVYFTSKSFQE